MTGLKVALPPDNRAKTTVRMAELRAMWKDLGGTYTLGTRLPEERKDKGTLLTAYCTRELAQYLIERVTSKDPAALEALGSTQIKRRISLTELATLGNTIEEMDEKRPDLEKRLAECVEVATTAIASRQAAEVAAIKRQWDELMYAVSLDYACCRWVVGEYTLLSEAVKGNTLGI